MINGRLRRPWLPEDRAAARERCVQMRPWDHSTGPRTNVGKLRSKANGCHVDPKPGSRRQLTGALAEVNQLIADVSALCADVDHLIRLHSPVEPTDDYTGDSSV